MIGRKDRRGGDIFYSGITWGHILNSEDTAIEKYFMVNLPIPFTDCWRPKGYGHGLALHRLRIAYFRARTVGKAKTVYGEVVRSGWHRYWWDD